MCWRGHFHRKIRNILHILGTYVSVITGNVANAALKMTRKLWVGDFLGRIDAWRIRRKRMAITKGMGSTDIRSISILETSAAPLPRVFVSEQQLEDDSKRKRNAGF
jgi:hypothetical protein